LFIVDLVQRESKVVKDHEFLYFKTHWIFADRNKKQAVWQVFREQACEDFLGRVKDQIWQASQKEIW
jgi:hypothetical protein